MCQEGKARRDPNEGCKEYDHNINIPVILTKSSFVVVHGIEDNNGSDIYHNYIPVYIKNVSCGVTTCMRIKNIINALRREGKSKKIIFLFQPSL